MLQISKADYDMIRWEAARSYPNECCGILLGNSRGSQRVVMLTVTCENMNHDSPGSRYRIDPGKVIAALKLAQSRSETIIGFYHSHPDHPANYSAHDMAEAHWFDCSYVITAVDAGRAGDTKSFTLMGSEGDKHFAEEPIEIVAYQGLPVAL